MKHASLPAAYADALKAFHDASGVIQYYAFEPQGRSGLALHHDASIAAFAELRATFESPYFQFTCDPSKMIAQPMSVDTFVGVISTSEGVFNSPADFLVARARALSEKRGITGELDPSYVRAFVDPPYGLLVTPEEAQRIYDVLNEHLFGGFRDDLDVLSWSNDWSNWFDAGLEWWGAFWWTIHNRTRGLIAVVTASATD
jgi:hypothetical protein